MIPDDPKINHILALFFGLGIAESISTIVDIQLPILSIVYSIGLVLIIFNFTRLKEGKYIWEPGLGIIGIFALLYFLFLMIGYKEDFFNKLSASINILVWVKCIRYLTEDKDDEIEDEKNEETEKNEEDGNI